MKQKSQEHTFFKNTKKKYRWSRYFFFPLSLILIAGWYRFCIDPFLYISDRTAESKITQHEYEYRLRKVTEQEATLSQAKVHSFTQEKLIDLADRASEYDITLTECSVQERSVYPHITKTTLFLKMEGEYIDIARFIDAAAHDLLCSVDTLQMAAGQQLYQASVTLTCATLT